MIVTYTTVRRESECDGMATKDETRSASVRMTWAELVDVLAKHGVVRDEFKLDYVRLEGDPSTPPAMRHIEISLRKERS